MSSTKDISWFDLSFGYALLIIPLFLLYYYQTGLIKSTIYAIIRMTIQLLLVGFYLEYLFKLNHPLINILWIIIMLIIASFTIIKRSELNRKLFIIPVILSLVISVFIVDVYFLGFILGFDYLFDARYLIPITGMMIGNCLSNNIVALNSFYDHLSKELILYKYSIANGATKGEALRIFMKKSLLKSINPIIASTAVVGLISLPGMMTGQILGGSNPMVAIKYQIMIMITILVSSIITIVLSIKISNKFVFNDFDMPLKNIRDFKKRNK